MILVKLHHACGRTDEIALPEPPYRDPTEPLELPAELECPVFVEAPWVAKAAGRTAKPAGVAVFRWTHANEYVQVRSREA